MFALSLALHYMVISSFCSIQSISIATCFVSLRFDPIQTVFDDNNNRNQHQRQRRHNTKRNKASREIKKKQQATVFLSPNFHMCFWHSFFFLKFGFVCLTAFEVSYRDRMPESDTPPLPLQPEKKASVNPVWLMFERLSECMRARVRITEARANRSYLIKWLLCNNSLLFFVSTGRCCFALLLIASSVALHCAISRDQFRRIGFRATMKSTSWIGNCVVDRTVLGGTGGVHRLWPGIDSTRTFYGFGHIIIFVSLVVVNCAGLAHTARMKMLYYANRIA